MMILCPNVTSGEENLQAELPALEQDVGVNQEDKQGFSQKTKPWNVLELMGLVSYQREMNVVL